MSKHLTLTERKDIELYLKERKSFKEIGRIINKDCTTISKEIRLRLIERKSGSWGQAYNACKHRINCHKALRCYHPDCDKKKCYSCDKCNYFCKHFEEEKCSRLDKPPYVCNGCTSLRKCTLRKRFYYAKEAQKEYEYVRTEARSGIAITEDELSNLNKIVTPLIKQGQSIHHICINNADLIMHSEKTIYNYIDEGVLGVDNIDLPRKVRYRPRKKESTNYKVDKACRIGRTYEDYLAFMEEYNDPLVVQMDTVIGKVGGKCLLSIFFVKAAFTILVLRDSNDSQSVIDFFNRIVELLGVELFKILFPVCLADNGSEFSNPLAIEVCKETGEIRTRVFYCDPSAPFQKGAVERNHEEIRRILPKGTSFDHLTQDDISLMVNHINSYSRPSLGDKTPYEAFKFLYGQEALEKLEANLVPVDKICLKPSLLKQ